ncbi:ATP-binding cassette domain-containing protein [Bacillus sp. TH11]|nr:ATP-binding cassette domain-containing protein [Bacillus sp. TH11]
MLTVLYFLAVGIAFYMFISTIIPKTSITLFFGLIFAVFFPILSLVSIYTDKVWLKPIKFITPYNYSILGGYYILINVLLAVLLVVGTMITFERERFIMKPLEAVDIKKSFGNKEILKGIDFSLTNGEICGFIGRNGAGKSTFINIITGIMRTTSGTIKLFGNDTHIEHKELGVLPDYSTFL